MSYNSPTAGLVMEKARHHLTILILLLLVSLFVSFIVWIVGSALASGGC